jgi:transcriptional regulator with XRE-family HTH domain
MHQDLLRLPNDRFNAFLDELAEQGTTQQEVARKLCVSAAYLSDCKRGRRSITELFARRLEHAYGRHHRWFLEGERIFGGLHAPEHADRFVLPVFPHPIEGAPSAVSSWDGTRFEVCGVAATRALDSHWPYVLRLGSDDRRGRLKTGDLILVSQKIDSRAEVQVIKHNRKILLARPKAPKGWESVFQKRRVPGDPEIIGHCVAVVWAALQRLDSTTLQR